MSLTPYKQFIDLDYTKFRKIMLREKGGERQREFLESVRNSKDFISYIRREVPSTGSQETPISPDPITEDEFKNPPPDTEARLYKLWFGITPRVACQSTFWAHLTCRYIEDGKIKSAYLAASGDRKCGLERIDRALDGVAKKDVDVEIDRCVRTVLRQLGGIPEVRGNRTVYVNCPFARAWWRERMVQQISEGNEDVAEQVREVVRVQNYWEKFIDHVVSRNSTFGSLKIRNAFMRTLSGFISENPESIARETKGLQRACRQAAMRQGAQELSILDDGYLDKIMLEIVQSV